MSHFVVRPSRMVDVEKKEPKTKEHCIFTTQMERIVHELSISLFCIKEKRSNHRIRAKPEQKISRCRGPDYRKFGELCAFSSVLGNK